jgi:phospholipid/cholesterol/gamma-HCH transport system permease protein
MEDSTPRIEQQDTPQGRLFVVQGAWTAAGLTGEAVWEGLTAQLKGLGDTAGSPAGWSLEQIGKLDHLGAQVLWNHWGRDWPANLQAEPSQRAVLETVAKFSAHPPGPRRKSGWSGPFILLGERVFRLMDHLKGLVRLIGQLLLDILRLIKHPQEGPWRDLSGHLFHIGATALPITALVGFLIGVVLAYLTAQQLRQFGADAYIVDILGIALVRELGPMLAAILIAGRSGSAITAQIGVMRVTDELDAMRVMGISHTYRLVMPRAMALSIAMPLISAWTTVAGLIGGMVAADLSLGISPIFFIKALPAAVSLPNLVLGMTKSVVFGILIALIGCHFGLRVQPNTESLGEGTTASVVTAITMVILVDALFAILFSSVGM